MSRNILFKLLDLTLYTPSKLYQIRFHRCWDKIQNSGFTFNSMLFNSIQFNSIQLNKYLFLRLRDKVWRTTHLYEEMIYHSKSIYTFPTNQHERLKCYIISNKEDKLESNSSRVINKNHKIVVKFENLIIRKTRMW